MLQNQIKNPDLKHQIINNRNNNIIQYKFQNLYYKTVFYFTELQSYGNKFKIKLFSANIKRFSLTFISLYKKRITI